MPKNSLCKSCKQGFVLFCFVFPPNFKIFTEKIRDKKIEFTLLKEFPVFFGKNEKNNY